MEMTEDARSIQERCASADMSKAKAKRIVSWKVEDRLHYRCASTSLPDVTYEQRYLDGAWACDCLGATHHHHCLHIGAVARRAKREGWDFLDPHSGDGDAGFPAVVLARTA